MDDGCCGEKGGPGSSDEIGSGAGAVGSSTWAEVRRLEEAMEIIAPTVLAESWDNVGLLVESASEPTALKVLCCIDLNDAVVDEALAKKANLILAYHPTIFSGLKKIRMTVPIQRVVCRCLGNGISIYSPHTALDSVKGGVNDWLADTFEISERVRCQKHSKVDGAMVGRLVTLSKPQPLSELIRLIKGRLKLSSVRVAFGHTSEMKAAISTIAICAGSGGGVFKGVTADLLWTGEMGHHEVLAAIQTGTSVVLCDHTNTERPYLPTLVSRLRAACIEAEVSEADEEPLSVY